MIILMMKSSSDFQGKFLYKKMTRNILLEYDNVSEFCFSYKL